MVRKALIQLIQRRVAGGVATDDTSITEGLVSLYISNGLAIAAKKNYTENFQLEGVGFVNNSYFSTFKGLVITPDEEFLYKFTLPQIPIGIGANEGLSRVVFKNADGKVSLPAVILTEGQVAIQRQMRDIPNKILCYPEGVFCYAFSKVMLNNYTATATLVSGGNANDLNSVLNVPDDSINLIIDYCVQQLMAQVVTPQDNMNDGSSVINKV